MFHVSTLLAAAETHVELPLPTWAYGAIAFVVFLILAGITFSYRDVAHRRVRSQPHGAQSHEQAHHDSNHAEGH